MERKLGRGFRNWEEISSVGRAQGTKVAVMCKDVVHFVSHIKGVISEGMSEWVILGVAGGLLVKALDRGSKDSGFHSH